MHKSVCVCVRVSNFSTSVKVSYLLPVTQTPTNPTTRVFICGALKNSGLTHCDIIFSVFFSYL